MTEIPEGYVIVETSRPEQTVEYLRARGVPVVLVREATKWPTLDARPLYTAPEWAETLRWQIVRSDVKSRAIRAFARDPETSWRAAALTVLALGGDAALDRFVKARRAEELAETDPLGVCGDEDEL